MGMTMAEKILASRSGADVVTPGQYVWADVDGTGIFGPLPMLDQLGITKVYDKARVYAVDVGPHVLPGHDDVGATARGEDLLGHRHAHQRASASVA